MAWANVIGAGAAIVGGLVSAKGSKDAAKAANAQQQTTIDAAKMDPRHAAMIYGDGSVSNGIGIGAPWQGQQGQNWGVQPATTPQLKTNNGLLGEYKELGEKPQLWGLEQYGEDNLKYLGNANQDMGAIRSAATGLLGGIKAPQAGAAQVNPNAFASNSPSMVNAPGQNNLDLTGAYDGFINGERGNNPYLTGAIGKGINQSKNAFDGMVTDAKAATQDVLGGIRSNSVLTGQYGGSRQGVAEGKAIESMNTQLGRAASQFGQNNTDAAVSAQAGAYESDSNRALSATQGLGAQQYGVASQDAAAKNMASMANTQAQNNAMLTNAGYQQQTNMANLSANQNTAALNQSGIAQGSGMLSGLLSGAAGVGQYQDGYGLNKATQTNSLLAPYLLNQPNVPVMQQYSSNSAGAALGGAAAGLGLFNQLKGSFAPPKAGGTQYGEYEGYSGAGNLY